MPGYELTGTVKVVMDVVRFDSGFTKREFVVTTVEERYPQDIKFECVKERCELLNDVKPGQRVTVSFDLRGNEFKGKYFVSLSAWKVQAVGGSVDEVPFDVPGESLESLMAGKDPDEKQEF
jgi:hypothetical protein